jgi:hypothetical protein
VKTFRHRQEQQGWRALERETTQTEAERITDLKDVIIDRCGLCPCARELLLELTGFIDKQS